jgi:hypothetical protein
MASTTTNRGYPFLQLGDMPDIAGGLEDLANAVDADVTSIVGDIATNAQRATILAAIYGSAVEVSTQTSANATTTATSNAAMTVAAVIVGHSFVACPSGKVRLVWGGTALHSLASGSTIVCGAAVADGGTVGSGTVESDAADVASWQVNGTEAKPAERTRIVTGLTPGNTYNCFIKWRETGGGTATCIDPFIISSPEPV